MVFNAVERANSSVAQTSKKRAKRNQMNWVAAALERLVSETTFKRSATSISSQPLCILLTKQDILKIVDKIIKEQL